MHLRVTPVMRKLQEMQGRDGGARRATAAWVTTAEPVLEGTEAAGDADLRGKADDGWAGGFRAEAQASTKALSCTQVGQVQGRARLSPCH